MCKQKHLTLALSISIAWSITLTASFTHAPSAAFLSPSLQASHRTQHHAKHHNHINSQEISDRSSPALISRRVARTRTAVGPLHVQSQTDEASASTPTMVAQEISSISNNNNNNNNNHHNNVEHTNTNAQNPQSSDDAAQEPDQPPGPEPPPPHASQTLDGRLLCASQCAYATAPPYFRAASYRPTTVAKRVTRGVNSALIGHTTDGITIAFRGTQTTSLLDWLQNAALFLSDVDEKYNKLNIKGKIHTGFYRGTKSLWKPIKGILREMLEVSKENGWSQNIYLTGHSKGGAMASIAAVLLKRDPSLPDPTFVW